MVCTYVVIGSSRNAFGYIFLSDWDPKCDTPAFHQSPTLVDCLKTCACAIFLYVVSQFEKPRALDSVKQTFPPFSPPFNQHLLGKKKNDWAVVVQVRRKTKKKKKRLRDARSVVASISAVAVLFLFCPLFSIPGLQAKRARGHNG